MSEQIDTTTATSKTQEKRKIYANELSNHTSEDDLWIVVNGNVYDLTNFYRKHPGGPDQILELAGKDGTERFEASGHVKANRIELETYLIGEYVPPKTFSNILEIAEHNRPDDLWLLIDGKVYDVTGFKHPGKIVLIIFNLYLRRKRAFSLECRN